MHLLIINYSFLKIKMKSKNCNKTNCSHGQYYNLLGVNCDATPAQIRKSYIKKALKYWSDRNPTYNSIEIFECIQEAYKILRDPITRTNYDK